MELKFRPYKNEDYQNQRKLFKLSFPEAIDTSVVSDSHYNWKFNTFPNNPAAYQYVAEDTELVGYYAAIPYRYKIGNTEAVCGMVCDVMTHPDRRGKGIFTKLGKFATDQLKLESLNFTSGYPIRPEVIPGHLKVGWEIVVKMPMYLRLLGVKSFLPKPIKFIAFAIDPLIRALQFWTEIKNKNYTCSVFSREDFLSDRRYSSFLSKWLSEQKNALIKDQSFLSWRTSAPETKYEFLVLEQQNQIVGISIVRSTILKKISSLAIIDMMVLKSHWPGCSLLHQTYKAIARKNGNDVIVAMTTPTWAKNYKFWSFLYLPTPAVFSLIIKKLSGFNEEADLFIPENWHLFWIDSDDL